MDDLQSIFDRLNKSHADRLAWFSDRAGQISNYPEPLGGGLLLASKGKAIYKPSDLDVALSVRIMLQSPYRDGEVFTRPDGTWCVAYHQEVDRRLGNDPLLQREALWTNRSIDECFRQRVPLGVLKEIPPLRKSGRSRYLVLGLAIPVGWDDGRYLLEGIGPSGVSESADTRLEVLEAAATSDLEDSSESGSAAIPSDGYDARLRVMRQIVARRGQKGFRDTLLSAYGRRCAVTECDVVDVLEAAHIIPYRGPESNSTANGLLLRADVHTLFDLQLISIEPSDLRVRVSKRLVGTHYERLEGKALRLPELGYTPPSKDALSLPYGLFLTAEKDRERLR